MRGLAMMIAHKRSFFMKIFYFIVMAALLSFVATSAQTPPYFQDLQSKKMPPSPYIRWTNFGPAMSGYVDEYFLHPTDPNSMYMSLDMGNSYYSHDNGQSWITTKDWDHDGENYRPTWMDFSRQDPDFGFAIDEKGNLLKTTDRGTTFSVTHSFGKKHSVITVDPNNDNNWYVGAGQFWRVKFIHRSLSNLHGTQYRNTYYGYIYVSKDKGATWTKITDNFDPNLDVAKIFVDPENSNIVYAYTNYGFYKSDDGGYHWSLQGEGLPYNQPRDGDYYYDPSTGRFILYLLEQTHYEDDGNGSVITYGGVYKSEDRGASWVSITGNLAIDLTQLRDYQVEDRYYRAIAYWFDIDKTTAQSRFPTLPKSVYTVFNRLVVSKKDPDVIFLSHNLKHDYAFGPGDIWRTKDGGANWTVCGRTGVYWVNRRHQAYWESRNNPLGMNMKYAHLDHEMRTNDVMAGTRMLLSRIDGDIICGHEQQMFRSKDNGDTWQQIDDDETAPGSGYWVGRGGSNLPGENIITETGMSRYLFCSGEHGLWISAPDGSKVKQYGVAVEQLTGQSKEIYDATSITTAAVHPADTNKIYIMMFRQSHRGYLRRSVDCGQTWENISYPVQSTASLSPESNKILQVDLMFDKQNPDIMFFCVPFGREVSWTSTLWERNGAADFNDFGVYRSKDGGFTWNMANAGLPAYSSVYRLAMDPQDSKIMYAALNKINFSGTATANGGLYKTINGADSWEKVNIPTEIEGVNHVFVDRNNGYIYISAGEYRGAIDKGGVWVSKDKGTSWSKIFFMPFVKECYSSNVNPDLIVVNVGRAQKVGNRNPGVYISKDGGSNWTKANYQLGQPARIRALRPDPKDEHILWVALKGSGWYKGIITGANVRALANNISLHEDETGVLDATSSVSETPIMSYRWETTAALQLSSASIAKPSITAPKVSRDTTYKVELYVSTTESTDSLQVLVEVLDVQDTTKSEEPPKVITGFLQQQKVKEAIYPNPADDMLTVPGLPGDTVFYVISLTGKVQIQTDKNPILVSRLRPGLYLLRMEGNGWSITKTFIKK